MSTVPGVWSEGRWLVEPESGRRVYVVAELAPGEHAPIHRPGPSGPPPLLAWALIICSAALVGLGSLAALLVVDPRSSVGGGLTIAVIASGLVTMGLCAVAAARLQDAHQRPVELPYVPVRTTPQRAAVRHLRPVEVAGSRHRPGLGKGAPLD